jgi:alpha-beta hydrolase superfamily lysophospholipase
MLVDLVQVVTRDGVRLEGMFQPAVQPTSLRVDGAIFIHGTGGSFYSSTLFDLLAEGFRNHGVATLRINTRGHDGISTAVTARGGRRLGAAYELVDDCRHDLFAWIDWLRERSGRRIALVGHSLGAVKSLYAAAFELTMQPECVVAISPPRLSYSWFCENPERVEFLKSHEEAAERIQCGRPQSLMEVTIPLPMAITAAGYAEKYGSEERYNLLRFLTTVACPVLLTYGTVEVGNNVAFRQMPEVLQPIAKRHGQCEVRTIADADHYYTKGRADLLNTIVDWLRPSEA